MLRDVFEPVPDGERDALLDAYARFLAERDGAPDHERRTLARREEVTRRWEEAPASFDGAFDHALFAAQYDHYDRRRATPDEMLVLLVFVKTNANEAYAVEQALKRPPHGSDLGHQLERLVLLEEGYHTRLLLSAARLFGVTVTHASPPVASTRVMVAGITKLPEAASRPITFSGEIVGIMTFIRLLDATRRIFAGRGELRDAMEERLMEVLVDEVGHLSLNRLLMQPGGFRAARAVLPAVGLGTRGALPEAEALGVLPLPIREVVSFETRNLPEEVRRQAFIA